MIKGKECHGPPFLLSKREPWAMVFCPARNPVVEVENERIVGGIKKSGTRGVIGTVAEIH